MGSVHEICGNSGGVGGGGVIFVLKKRKFWGGRGNMREIRSVVGVGIFSGNTHSCSLLV